MGSAAMATATAAAPSQVSFSPCPLLGDAGGLRGSAPLSPFREQVAGGRRQAAMGLTVHSPPAHGSRLVPPNSLPSPWPPAAAPEIDCYSFLRQRPQPWPCARRRSVRHRRRGQRLGLPDGPPSAARDPGGQPRGHGKRPAGARGYCGESELSDHHLPHGCHAAASPRQGVKDGCQHVASSKWCWCCSHGRTQTLDSRGLRREGTNMQHFQSTVCF